MTNYNISFIQPNFQQGPKDLNSFYLPYSVGCLWAYAKSFPHIDNQFKLNQLIWRRDKIPSISQNFCNDDIIAFSTYVWNKNYNYTLAQEIKKHNNKALMIFGGPEVDWNNPNIFKECPFIDIIVITEGERAFKDILEAYPSGDYSKIPGIVINKNGEAVFTEAAQRIDDLDILPSPYTTGLFDQLIADHPDIEWAATLETNRGCPFQCTFCDWGGLTYSKVKKFGLERVFDELEWIGKNCDFVVFADANIGIFVERDRLWIDKYIEVVKKYNRIKSWSGNWTKNQKNEVVELVKKLSVELPNQGQGLTVSVQSMNLQVLENIKRKNLDQHKLEEIFTLCEQKQVPVYTEMITGLPGESLESFKNGCYDIIRAGNHNGLKFNIGSMILNTEMNLLQRKLFKMKTVLVNDVISPYIDEIAEPIELIRSTSTITEDEMIELLSWTAFMQTFHIGGITTMISRYLYKSQGLEYQEFYDRLWTFLNQDPEMYSIFQLMNRLFEDRFNNGHFEYRLLDSIEIYSQNSIMALQMTLHANDKLEHVFALVYRFLLEELILPSHIADQLLLYVTNHVTSYARLTEYPKTVHMDYDFLGYIINNTELNQPVTYLVEFNDNKFMSKKEFVEKLQFRKKRNFGINIITQVPKTHSLECV